MGDTFGGGDGDEKPVHEVCVSDFFIGKFEVTQGEWEKNMGSNPSHFVKRDRVAIKWFVNTEGNMFGIMQADTSVK